MARLNLDDDFWLAVDDLCGALDRSAADLLLAKAVRFMRLAQQRYADDKIITVADFNARGFPQEFIGPLAEYVDENSIMATFAAERFGWLRGRKAAGHKGGVASAAKRSTEREINDLGSSKRKQHSSKLKPIPITSTRDINNILTDYGICEEAARKVLSAITRYSANSESDRNKMREELGWLHKVVCNVPGGFSAVRSAPKNDWTVRNVAGMLRASAEELISKGLTEPDGSQQGEENANGNGTSTTNRGAGEGELPAQDGVDRHQ